MIHNNEEYAGFYNMRNVCLIFSHFVLVHASKVWTIHNNEEYAHFYDDNMPVFTMIGSLMRKMDHMMNVSDYRSSNGIVYIFPFVVAFKQCLKYGSLKIA